MIRTFARGVILTLGFTFFAALAQAQQYAALVMDARSGRVLHEVNADTRLHPASLTKMMTLYIVFDEVRRGRLSLDQKISISAAAAAEPPSKLGLRKGQSIELRYLIRAAAIKSANDAATAMGEAVAGSPSAFADRMNQYARAMGMSNTTFKNSHGLTATGHLSSARDMAILGRRLIYDFPQYYNIFSRNATSAGLATVSNTNRRLLDAYPGADGIKTGYTRAAGFNLVSSAERGNRRVIVAVFGGKSSATRNAEVARLMDLGFERMPARANLVAPAPLRVTGTTVASARPTTTVASARPTTTVASARPTTTVASAALTTGVASTASVGGAEAARSAVSGLSISVRPRPRVASGGGAIARNSESIAAAIAEVNAELAASQATIAPSAAGSGVLRPLPRPGAARVAAAGSSGGTGSASTFAALAPDLQADAEPEAITIASASGTTGGEDWGVQLGAFRAKGDAERQLLTTALKDLPQLNGGLRRVEAANVQGVTVYRAQFVGLSRQDAQLACENLGRLGSDCMTLAPGI